ncbi:MAG: hypothetical protein H0T79_11045 [Deltaproteobacteria bacterium]|nr:hypothetical protein [Deltaproteobacteria bacterium]
MRAGVVMVVGLALAGCGKSPSSNKTQRTGSATVELVNEPVPTDGGRGGTSDEVEPNDGEDVATPLAVGATVRGRIDQDGDVDHFRIDVTQAGVLALDVTGIEGVDLTVELEDSSGTAIAKSDRGGARVREGLPNFGVGVGRYIAVVRAKKVDPAKQPKPPKPKKGKPAPAVVAAAPAGPSPVYEITASVAPLAAGAEREPDDDRGTANDLILGDTATGHIGWSGDVDAWKLSIETLSDKNAIDLELSAIEGVALTLELADGIGQPLLTRKGPRGAKLVVRGVKPVLAQGAAPFHYVTVRSDRSNPETGYQLRVSENLVGPDAELEPNDTPEKAMAMPADRTTVKATWTTGDVDCFELAPTEAVRTLDLTLTTPGEVDFAVELLVDGKSLAKADHPGKGVAEKLSGVAPANGKVVIRVRAPDATASGEAAYTLVVQESVVAPQ